jgi:hypothetical protein
VGYYIYVLMANGLAFDVCAVVLGLVDLKKKKRGSSGKYVRGRDNFDGTDMNKKRKILRRCWRY